jgi:hypothetical protein
MEEVLLPVYSRAELLREVGGSWGELAEVGLAMNPESEQSTGRRTKPETPGSKAFRLSTHRYEVRPENPLRESGRGTMKEMVWHV